MGRYTGLTGSIVFVRGNDQEFDVVGRYRVSTKATLIVSPAVAYENTLGVLSEYVEAKKANIHFYANGEVEILVTDREYLPHKLNVKADHVVELVTDTSKRLETARDVRVYVFGRKVVLSIHPTERGYMIYTYRNKDAYVFLKPVIEKIREKHAIEI
jgi:hypothetical protein